MENDDEQDRILDALDHVKSLVQDDQEEGARLSSIDYQKLSIVIAYASNASNYRDQRNQAHAEKNELETNLGEAQATIDDLKTEIKNYRVREATHAGMCAAFEKALIATAQGFATGK